MVKPHFSPEISLGNLIQVISVVTMIGGGAITSYVSLRSDIAASGERSGKAIADMNGRVLVLEARREMDERFQQEARRDLGRLLEAVADLRVQLVRKQDSGSVAGK
jgi:hypothetical protein